MDEDEIATFIVSNLKDQLNDVITIHTPSELKMVYMRVCMILGMVPDPDYFKSPSKGKIGLEEIIWDNKVYLRKVWRG